MDLTKIDGCYSKELSKKAHIINRMCQMPSVSLEELQLTVHKIVGRATITAKAKARFIQKLDNCSSKDQVKNLCDLAVIHGKYYRPYSYSQKKISVIL